MKLEKEKGKRWAKGKYFEQSMDEASLVLIKNRYTTRTISAFYSLFFHKLFDHICCRGERAVMEI